MMSIPGGIVWGMSVDDFLDPCLHVRVRIDNVYNYFTASFTYGVAVYVNCIIVEEKGGTRVF